MYTAIFLVPPVDNIDALMKRAARRSFDGAFGMDRFGAIGCYINSACELMLNSYLLIISNILSSDRHLKRSSLTSKLAEVLKFFKS